MTLFSRRSIAISAVIFGVLTVFSGGSVLFGSTTIKTMAGNTINFVLWFNFLSGAAYVLAGIGIWLQKRWARPLAHILAGTVIAVLVLFLTHVLSGGAYEMRTVAAMIFRAAFWATIAYTLQKSDQKLGR